MQPIRIMMLGAAGIEPSVPEGSYEHIVADPSDATCNITFDNDGTTDVSVGVSPPFALRWLPLAGTPANYWIRWTNTSGTLSTGTAGSWLQMSSDRTFGVERTAIGIKSCTGTVEFATDALGADIVASGSISLTAEVS